MQNPELPTPQGIAEEQAVEIIETFTPIMQDIQTVGQEKLGRKLTNEEIGAVVDSIRKAYDWDFYLGECIRACQDSGKIGPAVSTQDLDPSST